MSDFDLSFIPALFKPSALLPVSRHKESILYTIETYPITIIIGQTGSGKTTQIPQFLESGGWCKDGKIIAVTQPRRVAVTSVAARVADEMRCQIGQEVGYSIRFEDVTSAKTKIKFLTDGMLLCEALVDPLLTRYSVIMVDEAHERSLSSDVLLGLLKKIRKKRPELRIIVSSATLEAQRFVDFFTSDSDGDGELCRIVSIEGRTYPVDIHHLDQPTENYVGKAIETAIKIHKQEGPGDILVFLTGREEIETSVQKISDYASSLLPNEQVLHPFPLYAGLPTEEQMYIFSPAAEHTRKVIFSTNIAEASVTIPGIVYVIDSGFVKLRSFNPMTNIETLTPVAISRASATQRAGRAGRTQSGKCYRLYTEASYNSLSATTPPEIQRSNLAPLVLQLKALGIDNIARFDFLSPPPSELLIRALEHLYALGALDMYAKLTSPLGMRMAELPALSPMIAKALLTALEPRFDCLSEMLSIAAMTSIQSPPWFSHEGERKAMESSRRKFAADEGDHITLLNVYQAFVTKGKKDAKWCHSHHLNFKTMTRAVSIRNQLRRYLEKLGIDVSEPLADNDNTSKPSYYSTKHTQSAKSGSKAATTAVETTKSILQCLTTGLFAHAAKMQADGTYRPASSTTSASSQNSLTLHVHPTSLLFNRKAEWVLFNEIMETSDKGKAYIKDLSKIEKNWLLEFSNGYYAVTGGGGKAII